MEIMFLLIAALLNFIPANAQSCPIPNLTPTGPLNASSGENTNFHCQVTPVPSRGYLWQINGVPNAHSDPTWYILPMNVQGGVYRCGYNCDNGSNIWSNSVTVLRSPQVSISIANNGVFEEDSDVTLTCSSSYESYPAPSFTWIFNNKEIENDPMLVISSVSFNDTGVYTCTALSAGGYSSSSVNITVIARVLPTSTTQYYSSSSSSSSSNSSTDSLINDKTTALLSIVTPSATQSTISPTISITQPTPTPPMPSPPDADTIRLTLLTLFFVVFGISILFCVGVFICFVMIGFFKCICKRKEPEDKQTLIDGDELGELGDMTPKTPLATSFINEEYESNDIIEIKYDTPSEAVKTIVPKNDGVKIHSDKDTNELLIITKEEIPEPEHEEITMIGTDLIEEGCMAPDVLQEKVEEYELFLLQGRSNESHICNEYNAIPMNMQPMDLWPVQTQSKNRYRNVLPNKNTAVKLSTSDEDEDPILSAYINANHIKGYKGDLAYISAQAPIYETVPDFWQMIWESEVTTIIMLCGIVEGGKNKCAKYWPPAEENDTQTYGKYVVRNNYEETLQHYKVTYLTVYENSEDSTLERDICHFLFTGWPDFGVPTETTPILELREAVELNWSSGPILVHCSAGIGRSGTYIGLDLCINQYKEEGVVNPSYWTFKMREQRGGMIQTVEQYAFLNAVLTSFVLKN